MLHFYYENMLSTDEKRAYCVAQTLLNSTPCRLYELLNYGSNVRHLILVSKSLFLKLEELLSFSFHEFASDNMKITVFVK